MPGQRRQWYFVALAGLGAIALSFGSRALGNPERTALPAASVAANVIAKPSPPAVLIGDDSLRGQLDFDRIKKDGDHFSVPMTDGGLAQLTLDPRLQAAAESVLERAQAPLGAIVVTDVGGRVLAFAGRRNEKPAKQRDFSLPGEVWAPAASIFKIVTSAALLSSGVEPNTKVCYHGGLRSVDPSHLTDNPKRDRTCQSLSFGLAHSQNAIIAKLTNRHLDKKQLQRFANRFGFDRPIACAVAADQNTCTIPSEPLELARTSAGFWNSELSALGGAVLANTVASGGLQVSPRIVASITTKDGTTTPVVGQAPRRVIDEQVARDLTTMMEKAVSKGTGRKGFQTRRGRPYLDVKVAGKTGSLSRSEPSYLGYSWFVGFAPADEPRYVISVLLGNPMKWHLKAHTAARLVLQQALTDKP